MGHAVDIGNVREQSEVNHSAAIWRRVRGARLIEFDVRSVGNNRRPHARDLAEEASLVRRAAQIHAIGGAISAKLFPAQLAPIGGGVKASDQAGVGLRILAGQIVVDVVRIHDHRWTAFAGRSLPEIAVAEEREFEVDDVEPRRAQNPIEGRLQRRDGHAQPLETSHRGERAQLPHPFRQPFAAVRIGHQDHVAAIGLHGGAAFVGVEPVVDQHDGRQVMTAAQLAHQPVHARLRAEAWGAGRYLRDVKDIEAHASDRSGF